MTATRPAKRWRSRLVGWAIFSGLCWLVCSFVVTWRLTRRGSPPIVEALPAGVEIESVRLATTDGQELGAWWRPGDEGKPIIIALHGQGASRSHEYDRHAFLSRAGYSLFRVTQRSHGDSTGETHDFGQSNRHDVIAAVEWVRSRQPGRPVVIWGHSLGSAAALFAASELGDRVAGYILESPYRDLLTAVRNRTAMVFPAGIEWLAYAGLRTAAIALLPQAESISPLDACEGMPTDRPVLILAGDCDQHATMPEAESIRDRLGDRCQLIVIPGARHGCLQTTDPKRFNQAILTFLGRF